MNQLHADRCSAVIAALVEGVSINATRRMTGVAKHTVLKLLKDMGCAAAAYDNAHVRNLRCVVFRPMRFGLSCMERKKGVRPLRPFMRNVASRISNRIQLTTRWHRVYAGAVEDKTVLFSCLQREPGSPSRPKCGDLGRGDDPSPLAEWAEMPTTGDQLATQTDVINAWINATPIAGYNPSEWRRDEYGNAIHYASYGTTTEYGWEIDHRKPKSKGGTDNSGNLRALHWRANRAKSDRY